MSVTKVEVGKVYKYGQSEIYVIYIEENIPKKDRFGVLHPQPSTITASDLNVGWQNSRKRVLSNSEKLGEEVIKPFNKKDWGIKVLYSILYSEVSFMYDKLERSTKRRAVELKKTETLFSDIGDQCVGQIRSIKKYKVLLERKNSLCRLVLKPKSKSRGAAQRANRFDLVEKEKLPVGLECPPGKDEFSFSARPRIDENEGVFRNHMNLTMHEARSMMLGKEEYEFNYKFPAVARSSRAYGGLSMKNYLGIENFSSYFIVKIGGHEYFNYANIKDGKHFIKPYGWPELYKGRIQTKEEVKALRGKKNSKGLTYIHWLSITPRVITPLCGHDRVGCPIEVALNCKACARTRYEVWFKE